MWCVTPQHPTEDAGLEPAKVNLAPVMLHGHLTDRAAGLLHQLYLDTIARILIQQHVQMVSLEEVLQHLHRAGLVLAHLAPLIIYLSEPQLNLT